MDDISAYVFSRHWSRLSRDVVSVLSLETPKVILNRALSI